MTMKRRSDIYNHHNPNNKRKHHPFISFFGFILISILLCSMTLQINVFNSQSNTKNLIVQKISDDFTNQYDRDLSTYGINKQDLNHDLIMPIMDYEIDHAYNGQTMIIPNNLVQKSVNNLENHSSFSGNGISASINKEIASNVTENINNKIKNGDLKELSNINFYHKINNVVFIISAILFLIILILSLFKHSFWKTISLSLFSSGILIFILGMISLFLLNNDMISIGLNNNWNDLFDSVLNNLLTYICLISFIELCIGLMLIIIHHIFTSKTNA